MSTAGTRAAALVAERLRARGADTAFGVPGGGPNLDIVDALAGHGIRFVLAHSEASACIMASVYGYLTGDLSAAVVTRGPGAAAAVNGAAQATLDRHPLVLITDAVPSGNAHRVPHQRIDQQSMLAPVCKASAKLAADADGEALDQFLALATAAPAGAVHLDYDAEAVSDVQIAAADRVDGAEPLAEKRFGASLGQAATLLSTARKPVVIVGLGAVDIEALPEILEAIGAPVLTTYQAIGVIPVEHDLCAGLFTNGASEAGLLNQADLVLTIGLDPVEPIPAPWTFEAPVLALAEHPMTDPYYPTTVELIGPLAELFDALDSGGGLPIGYDWQADDGATYRRSTQTALSLPADRLRRDAPGVGGPDRNDAGVEPLAVVRIVAGHAPDDATVTVDAGAHFLAIMPFWPVRRPKQLLISNGLATMGYAVPAVIAACLARPKTPGLCMVGDGGLGMTLAELETIVRLDLPVTVVVFNDSALSLIRIKQRQSHVGSEVASYGRTDFAASARSMGMTAVNACTEQELSGALRDVPGDRPRLIDVRVDPEQYHHLITVTRG